MLMHVNAVSYMTTTSEKYTHNISENEATGKFMLVSASQELLWDVFKIGNKSQFDGRFTAYSGVLVSQFLVSQKQGTDTIKIPPLLIISDTVWSATSTHQRKGSQCLKTNLSQTQLCLLLIAFLLEIYLKTDRKALQGPRKHHAKPLARNAALRTDRAVCHTEFHSYARGNSEQGVEEIA